MLWRDGCPGGETPAQVGVRADRALARLCAADGDAIAFAHGHILRVTASRWIGLGPACSAGAGSALGSAGRGLAADSGHEHENAVVSRTGTPERPRRWLLES